ncbi:MAG: hypothetical protein NT007_06760 [Candidatus Kapabacteria bacterium]|nr:hypothetical protein [Candidatus Kapabacteria bacterium]
MKNLFFKLTTLLCAFLFSATIAMFAGGVIIPTDSNQKDFSKVYKFLLNQSSVDYRFAWQSLDTTLFPKYGDYSVYWIASGQNRGSFVYPDAIPATYSTISSIPYSNYDWQGQEHYSVQFKAYNNSVAIFRSSLKANNSTVSFEAVFFKNLFDSYLLNNLPYYVNEKDIDTSNLNWGTSLLIIPAFTVYGLDSRYYIDSIFKSCPGLKPRLTAFLASGGTIYAEGNAVYFIEKLGYLAPGAVNFEKQFEPDDINGNLRISTISSNHPVSFSPISAGNIIYSSSVPVVSDPKIDVIAAATSNENPVVFTLNGANAGGGRIICNMALPTVGGSNNVKSGKMLPGSKQLSWTFNAIMSAYIRTADVTRSVWNDLPDSMTVGPNAISYDLVDTFEIRVKVRNLSAVPLTNIEVDESFRDYFKFVDVPTQGINFTINGSTLAFTGINLAAKEEKVIVYRLRTPNSDDPIHSKVSNYISWANYIYASYNSTKYTDDLGFESFVKYRNYVDLMFSAKIVADADLNWKNFLSLNYQPFKIFMIMENKERTSAEQTVYTQYVPKDVPFYWTDSKINIPVLRTPGGKYVDVLHGSNDQGNPEYDMDSDKYPDAWLDTSSIYPKNYTITEDSVYWLNPWEHLRSGDTTYYEDINHDGIRAQDLNGDGIVDVEAPGDKIRVWKIQWKIGHVPGYQAYDPYCYFELWVDPPDLVPLAAGVGKANGKLDKDVAGMFYPYSPDINNPNLKDTSWTNWMERDKDGNIIWKQMIYQKIHNYEGFTFIDTLKENYRLKGTDECVGTVPQPHREFIAVLSLGGEEIDMTHPTPGKSLYSNIEYKTIFGENRSTPIRTTYTYYAPLPNPMQFEYLTNNFQITDIANTKKLKFLPEWGKVNLTFDIDASTEYSYYWIRNAGYDVKYNDPSLAIDGVDSLGDGVFGYMIYDIPKGMGGYQITLPKKTDGTFDINKIVEVDGKQYKKWIDNPNTKDSIEVYEDQFQYHVYIPQLLIPPALDDDNFDGIDDWIDDRGDRFQSQTGFLHDLFMIDNGEKWYDWPKVPFKDDIYGMVSHGWYPGADGTYGDDNFEALGKTHFRIHAVYEGQGKEGSVDISKGGTLVVEEIFGGSPWVIFSHALNGYSIGTDIRLTSSVAPSMTKFGVDTVYIKHVIEDANEPHNFDVNFDPYFVSYGYGETTVTSYAGGKDPCSLIMPNLNMSTIIDPIFNHSNVTFMPLADTSNPAFKGYPKKASGSFFEVRLEISNGTDDNWINTVVTPVLGSELGNTKCVFNYVVYPRPLVPAQVDATGKVLRGGDDFGTFRTGWRFNQPEGEVLCKLGDTLNLMQPSRRGYFIFVFSVDETLKKGVYEIPFKMSGQRKYYTGIDKGAVNFEVPPVMFSISTRNGSGSVSEFQKLVIGADSLKNIKTSMTKYMTGNENSRWTNHDVNYTDFDTLAKTVPAKYDNNSGIETLDLSGFKPFPTVETPKIYLLESAQVNSYTAPDNIYVTNTETLNYNDSLLGSLNKTQGKLSVSTTGPKMLLYKTITKVDGNKYSPNQLFGLNRNSAKHIEVMLEITNNGNAIADNTVLTINPGSYFAADPNRLPANSNIDSNLVKTQLGPVLPGAKKRINVEMIASSQACANLYDESSVLNSMTAGYSGNITINGVSTSAVFTVPDYTELDFPAYDFYLTSLNANTPTLTHGQKVVLSANVKNGVIPADNVMLDFYGIMNNKDTIHINTTNILRLDKLSSNDISVNYTIPDSAVYFEFFAKINGNDKFGEFCYGNNNQRLILPYNGPDWILNISNNPNPFDYRTQITYTLPYKLSSLHINLYSYNGSKVATVSECPVDIGYHSVDLFVPNIPKGEYIMKFEGVDSKTGKKEHYFRIMKEK